MRCLNVAVSKRARARLKIMTMAEKKAVAKAAKVLYEAELMGVKRMQSIMRLANKQC